MESNFTKETVRNGDSFGTRSSENPMLNTVVLETLFKYASLKEIKVFRQVCRTWWMESLSRWRRESWLQLFGFQHFLSGESNSGDPFQLEKYPFRKYELINWNTQLEIADQLNFWMQCGTNMTHLSIQRSTFHSREAFDSILFQYAPHLECLYLNGNEYNFNMKKRKTCSSSKEESFQICTTLKELRLDLNNMYQQGQLPINLFELLGRYSNVTSLEVSGTWTGERVGYLFHDILVAMLTLRKEHGVQWQLKKLNLLNLYTKIDYEFAQGCADRLQLLQFPLTSLSLDIGEDTPPGRFRLILETYAATLRKLVVFRISCAKILPQNSHSDFPFGVHLGSLVEMRLFGGAVMTNLNFLRFTPQLRSLYLVHEPAKSLLAAGPRLSDQHLLKAIRDKQQRSNWHFFPYPMSVVANTDFERFETSLPHMEEFIICGQHYQICTSRDITELAQLMPNLKKLRLGLGNGGFRAVCNAWKQLELLIIQPCEVDGSGILGTIPGLNIRVPSLVDLSRLRYFGFQLDTSVTHGNDLQTTRSCQIRNALPDFQSKFPDCTIVSFGNGCEEWSDLQNQYQNGGASSGDGWKGPEFPQLHPVDSNSGSEMGSECYNAPTDDYDSDD